MSDGQWLHRYRYPTKGTVSYYRPNLLMPAVTNSRRASTYINSGYHQRQRAKPAGNYRPSVQLRCADADHHVQLIRYSR